jgi:hypothetical protein
MKELTAFRKYLSEGIVNEDLGGLLHLIKNNSKEISKKIRVGELTDIKMVETDVRAISTTSSNEKHEIYFRKSEGVDEDFLDNDGGGPLFFRLQNQTIGYLKIPLESFDDEAYENRAEYNAPKLLQSLKNNQPTIESELSDNLTGFFIDDMGDVASENVDGDTGYSFRFINDGDGEFLSDGGHQPEEINDGVNRILVISYNI